VFKCFKFYSFAENSIAMRFQSYILKVCLFATGLSGIVAEYLLATMATYFIGDSVFQFTMIVSVMLFSMGLGSRLSKSIHGNLLKKFILIEFLLSVLVAFSALITYTIAAFSVYTGLIIYALSIAIGILIGMEIPLVIRLNDEFETLRINVASVIEKDYYGSLAGGIFFAFFGLPYLGLTYTPFILGFINFAVATVLLAMLWRILNNSLKKVLGSLACFVFAVLIIGFFFAKPVILYGEQKKYKDKVIFQKQSKYQKLVITQWKDHYWLYINGNQQFSTLDEVMYHEPLVHPVMHVAARPKDILIFGGGDGCAAREILKYPTVSKIDLVDIDPVMTDLAKNHPVLLDINKGSVNDPKVRVINEDGFTFINDATDFYDVIIIDLPDPKSIDLSRLYSCEFYDLCYKHLRTNGFLVTQAGSPYFATSAYLCIDTTLQCAGFSTARLHNQILTMGEWGWIIGSKSMDKDQLRDRIRNIRYDKVNTIWINNEAMQLMTSFGKVIYPNLPANKNIKINKISDPVLFRYYSKGNWDLY
jgi:spermidine synthase